MKLFFSLIGLLLSTCCIAQAQQEIDQALNEAFRTQSVKPLQQKMTDRKDPYWKSYNLFQQAIYQMHGAKNKQIASERTDSAIHELQKIRKKTSEEYALLGMIHSFSMQFVTDAERLKTDETEFYQYMEKALEEDHTNPRVYHVKGMYEFYKPEKHGGNKERAKKLLLKAKHYFRKKKTDEITWGEEYNNQVLNQLKE